MWCDEEKMRSRSCVFINWIIDNLRKSQKRHWTAGASSQFLPQRCLLFPRHCCCWSMKNSLYFFYYCEPLWILNSFIFSQNLAKIIKTTTSHCKFLYSSEKMFSIALELNLANYFKAANLNEYWRERKKSLAKELLFFSLAFPPLCCSLLSLVKLQRKSTAKHIVKIATFLVWIEDHVLTSNLISVFSLYLLKFNVDTIAINQNKNILMI